MLAGESLGVAEIGTGSDCFAAASHLTFSIADALQNLRIAVAARKWMLPLIGSDRRKGAFIRKILAHRSARHGQKSVSAIVLRVFRFDAKHCGKRSVVTVTVRLVR